MECDARNLLFTIVVLCVHDAGVKQEVGQLLHSAKFLLIYLVTFLLPYLGIFKGASTQTKWSYFFGHLLPSLYGNQLLSVKYKLVDSKHWWHRYHQNVVMFNWFSFPLAFMALRFFTFILFLHSCVVPVRLLDSAMAYAVFHVCDI